MGLLTTFLPNRKIPLPSLLCWGISVVRSPIKFFTNLVPIDWAKKSIILLVMQPIDNYIKLTYASRWWRLGRFSMNSQLSDGKKIPSHIPVGEKTADVIIQKRKGTVTTTYMDAIFNIPSTFSYWKIYFRVSETVSYCGIHINILFAFPTGKYVYFP